MHLGITEKHEKMFITSHQVSHDIIIGCLSEGQTSWPSFSLLTIYGTGRRRGREGVGWGGVGVGGREGLEREWDLKRVG